MKGRTYSNQFLVTRCRTKPFHAIKTTKDEPMRPHKLLSLALLFSLTAAGCHSHRPVVSPDRAQPFSVTTNADGSLELYRMIEEFNDISALREEPSEATISAFSDREPIEISSAIVCYTFQATESTTGATKCGVFCSDKSSYEMPCDADIFRDHGFDERFVE